MLTKKLLVIAASLLASVSFTAFAAQGGGKGGGGMAGGMAGGTAGGMSSSHISSQGLANTNGPDAADRDKGQERAADRMSSEGLSHDKADRTHGKHERQNAPTPK